MEVRGNIFSFEVLSQSTLIYLIVVYFQAEVENLSPEIYRTMITTVEKLRGYRVFVFRKMEATMNGGFSSFGNRGNVLRYEEKPYIVGRYVIQGLAGFYMRSDRTIDTYNKSKFKMWFHGDLKVERDSLVYVDRGNRKIDSIPDDRNVFEYDGIDFPYTEVLRLNDIQSFLVTEIKNKQGWGREILQFCTMVPKPAPIYHGVK